MPSRKPTFELPVKIIFTEDGVNFFIKNNKQLSRFRLADEQEAYGIALENFSYASLQRMININYVSKVEIAAVDFLSHRQSLMDLSKLIVYGMMYNKFDAVAFNDLIHSDLITRWNRLNPGKIIDERTHINDGYLESILRRNPNIVNTIKREILAPVKRDINQRGTLLPEEKNVLLLLSEKYLEKLRPILWYILSRYQGTRGYRDLVEEIRRHLNDFLEKSKISEYLALMILELLSYVENSNLLSFARRSKIKAATSGAIIYDSHLRQKLQEEMVRKDEKLYISWRLRGRGSSIGTDSRLTVTIYNRESEYQRLQQNINDKRNINLKEKNLMEFYQHMSEETANTELGLYYLSYLSEACNKVNVRFESNVNQINNRDLTVITLGFNF
jgi:hypothetical protein